MVWPDQCHCRAFLWLLLFAWLCLCLRREASRVKGSCLSRGTPVLHHYTLPAGAGAAVPNRAGPSCRIMPSSELRLSWPPTVYWALFQVCSGW